MTDARPVSSVEIDESTQKLLSQIPVVIAMLDENRRVVFGQDRLLGVAGHDAPSREEPNAPGDLLHCVNALRAEGGCGTSSACKLCGANKAIRQSMQHGIAVTHPCRIRYENGGTRDLDLTVTAAPYESAGQTFTMLTIQDASSERRRRALERVFFHDIMNVAGGIAGLATLLKDAKSDVDVSSMLGIMEKSAKALLGEIEAQRQLASAEAGELKVHLAEIETTEVVQDVVDTMRYHAAATSRTIALDSTSEASTFRSDDALLRRILINLTKNALEATPAGGIVVLGTFTDGESIRFDVSNPGVIPRDVQLQLFQRSFSTKGSDRGIGTYSVRLLTEQYLGGTISFVSDDAHQTVFSVTLPLEP